MHVLSICFFSSPCKGADRVACCTEDIALDEEEGSEDFTDGENEAAQLMQPAQDSGLVAVA